MTGWSRRLGRGSQSEARLCCQQSGKGMLFLLNSGETHGQVPRAHSGTTTAPPGNSHDPSSFLH